MDESYGGGPAAPEKSGMPVEKPETADKPSVDEQNAEEQTAIISNKILSPEGGPLKEGDEVVVRVVKNYGDESEVKYAPKKAGGESDSPGETDDSMGVGDELAALSNEKA